MAGPLAAVERFFERLFERPAARLFQARLEPVHIQRGLERTIESERQVVARRVYAPSAFRILLNATDLAALDGDRQILLRDLAESVRTYARARGYVLLARPALEIEPSTAVDAGDVRVYAQPFTPPPAESGNGRARQPAGIARPAQAGSAPLPVPPDLPAFDPADLNQNTAVFAAPHTTAPRAQLAVRAPNQPVSRLPVRPGTIRIGRALDNDVVLGDERVSRHHGQIGVRLGMLVYTDLGSTNGSFLNGSAVSEIALGPGDTLQLGNSTVTIEPQP
jgi:hypothetical protein